MVNNLVQKWAQRDALESAACKEAYIKLFLEETGLSVEDIILVEKRNRTEGTLEIEVVRKENKK